MASPFTFVSYLWRWVFALILVLATYNPTEYCYMHWLTQPELSFTAPKALVGVLLLIGWIVFLRATFLALGWLGVILFTALFAAALWVLVDLGWLSLEQSGTVTWLVLLLLSLILATGMSWAHIRRRLSGQVYVDDVED